MSYQLGRSVKAGVLSEGGPRREEIATVRALDLGDFLLVGLLHVVVQSVDRGVPLGTLSTGKVELRGGVVERCLDLLVDQEHVLLHLGLVGENLLADITNIAAVHLEMVGQTGLGGTVDPTQVTDELRLLLHPGLALPLLHLLADHLLEPLPAGGCPGHPVVHRGLAHLETLVPALEPPVQQELPTEGTVLRVNTVNVLLLSDDVQMLVKVVRSQVFVELVTVLTDSCKQRK